MGELRRALADHGITFPSSAVDPVSLPGFLGVAVGPLIELGRVGPETARKLTGVLRMR